MDAAYAARSAARGLPDREILRLGCRVLARRDPATAVRAALGPGLRELGPSGTAFEQFVARLLEADGYRTTRGARRRGRCVTHEIDVVAERTGRTLLCECKLRTVPGAQIELRVALAAYGRAADLDALGDGPVQSWLISNAEFTADARAFAEGMGLHLLGSGDARGEDLEALVAATGRYPVTALPHLPERVARELVGSGVVDTGALLNTPRALDGCGLHPRTVGRVLTEAAAVRVVPGAARR